MAARMPLFSPDERRVFLDELWAKFRSGLRSPQGVLYISVTLIAVGWATWGIPSINNSDISPETLGIYVIGFMISVMLDAGIVAWKNNKSISGTESAILVILSVLSLLLMCIASVLAIKDVNITLDPPRRDAWRWGATPLLFSILFIAICMSLVVTGMDQHPLNLAVTDSPVNINDRGAHE